MTEPRTSERPSRPVLIGALLMGVGILLVLVRLAARPLSNKDTYFHLRFGEEFLGGWSIAHPGSVTTFGTADWVPTQWLPQMGMAWVEEHVGLAALAWLLGLLLTTYAVSVYAVARRAADPLPSTVLCLATLVASGAALSMRPQLLSLVFLLGTVAAWQRAIRTGRAPWLVVPLTWLWTMCHGMWPFAVVLGVVTVAGLALDRRPRGVVLRMALVPVLSTLAAAATPVGLRIYGAIASVSSRRDYFTEWSPPDLRDPRTMMAALLLAAAVVDRLRRPGTSWTTVAWLLFAGAACTYSIRTVPLAAVVLVPLVAETLQTRLGREVWRPGRREAGLVAGLVVVALAALAVAVPRTSSEPPASPAWLEQALDDLPAGTPVLNEWNFGGYLIWRHPDLDFVMNGYGDLFTDDELARNKDILDLEPGWDDLVAETGSTYAVLNPGKPIAYALEQLPDWQVVQEDDQVVLLARDAS